MKERFLIGIILSAIFIHLLELNVGIQFLPLMLIASGLILVVYYKENYLSMLFLMLLIPLLVGVLKSDFDKNLFTKTHLEAHKTVARQTYYAESFGKLYKNRFGLFYSNTFRPIITKFTRNSFSQLDLNSFVQPHDIFSITILLLAVYGFLMFIKKPKLVILYYFLIIFFLGGFLAQSSRFGLIIYTPLFILFLYFGILSIFNIFTNEKFKI